MVQPAQLFADTSSPPLRQRERRPFTLAARATHPNGSISDMTVVDLSIDGCAVICTRGLLRGERFMLSVAGREPTGVTVRWVEDRRAGLSFRAPEVVTHDGRYCPVHRLVSMGAEVRRKDKTSFSGHVYDLWPEGCKAEFGERTELHEQLSIKFEGLAEIEASVRWIAAAKAGVKFMQPLHPAVIELLDARERGLTAP